MKLFLRYQLTGSVFIGWFVIFYFSSQNTSLKGLVIGLSNLETSKAILTVFAAYPIGVIIHQLSVLIKNLIIARVCSSFSDAPIVYSEVEFNCSCKDKINKSNITDDLARFYFEKISSLNTYYYVRFDNGFLSPLLSFISFCVVFNSWVDNNILYPILIFAIAVSILTVLYIPIIAAEIKVYLSELENLNYKFERRKLNKFLIFYYVVFIDCFFLLSLLYFFVRYNK